MELKILQNDGVLEINKKSNSSLDLYYGTRWEFHKTDEFVNLESIDNGYDLNRIIITAKNGIEKITFYNFSNYTSFLCI